MTNQKKTGNLFSKAFFFWISHSCKPSWLENGPFYKMQFLLKMDPIPLLCQFTGRYMNIGQEQKHPQQLIVLNPNVHERIAKGRLQHFPASNLNRQRERKKKELSKGLFRRFVLVKKIPLPKPLHFFLGFALKQPKHTIFMFHAFVLDHLFFLSNGPQQRTATR